MPSDAIRALEMVGFMSPGAPWLDFIVFKGDPFSFATLGHFRRGGLSGSRSAREALQQRFRDTFDEPHAGNLAVGCIFFRSNRHRIDADNMVKQVFDAANGICWGDDYQVTAQMSVVELDEARPRTVFILAPHESTLRRTPDIHHCKTCGNLFDPSYFRRKYCSVRCAKIWRGADLREEVNCAQCDKLFKRRTAGQRHCSETCRITAHVKRTRANAKPLPMCRSCGKQLSKHGYARCRECWRAKI